MGEGQVVALNRRLVERTHENHAYLQPEKLRGALARPTNRYLHEEALGVVELAAVTMFSVAQAHAFEQGNKRTGFAAGVAFLRYNGYFLSSTFDVLVSATLFREVVEGKADIETYEQLLERFVHEQPIS